MGNANFTFCIPNLNKIDFLPACIQGVLEQTSDTWHCVFVDGYSTDGSWEYMQQFAKDSRFTLLRGKRQGMYADWNYCLEQVNTEYFYFLTSDDFCYPQLISKTTQALDKHLDIDACHFKFEYINEHDQITRCYEDIISAEMPIYLSGSDYYHRRSALFEVMMHFVYRTVYRTITSLVLRKRVIAKVGPFSSDFGSAGDYDWTLRLGLHTDILFMPETLTAWRKYDGQATQSPHSLANNKRILDIAKVNYSRLLESSLRQKLGKTPDAEMILSRLSNDYEFELYKQLHQSRSVAAAIRDLAVALRRYPLHYLDAILKRLGRSPLRTQLARDELATKLVQEYQLQWPPTPIRL